MAIDEYAYGRIRIDGREYVADVLIGPEGVLSPWRRRQGHSLAPEDLSEVLRTPPSVLIIGTGYFGRMQVPPQTLAAFRARGVDTHVARTRAAVAEFNRRQREAAGVVAALHLTC